MSLRLMLGAAFVLALAAVVIVFVSPNDVLWLRLGIAAALWAALMSAFAVSRSRREAQLVAHREAEITRTYELELHREVTARREYESSLKQQVRDEAEQQNAQELKALRAQLDRLTDTLSGLLEGDVQIERLTLSADASRIRGLRDAQRGRIAHARRPEIDVRPLEDPNDDAVDAEVVEDGAIEDDVVGDGTVEDDVVQDSTFDEDTVGVLPESVDGNRMDGSAADGSQPAVSDTSTIPRAEAPEAAWASHHRQHVQQAAVAVAANTEARRRTETQQQERRVALAREQASAEVGTPADDVVPDVVVPDVGAPDVMVADVGVPDDEEAEGGHANDGTRLSVADLLASLGDRGDAPRRRRRAED